MRAFLERLEFEPGELERKQERLAHLTDLERRYQMTVDEIVSESEAWRKELGSIEFEDEERSKLRKEKNACLSRLRKAAVKLGESRRKAAEALDKKMTKELGQLMMAGARFRTDVSYEADASSDLVIGKQGVRIGPDGIDRAEFYVRTNPGEDEGALADVASSGELSRIALALKEMVSMGREGSLLIFDELDAGVGADLGEMIAKRLQGLARSYQIICITHMAQIAARADSHLVVSKRSSGGRTFAEVSAVDGDGRLAEIARMLGGKEGSEKRLALAHEMLQKQKSTISPEVRP
jgi:DNA repair protein RecN (Recombination protein N)